MTLFISFFFYFFCLLAFSLLSHPVYYCVLLVVNSLLCSFICYVVYGFSWYALLFCLVYIGGVYVLFVFVSVHSPNSSVLPYVSFDKVWFVASLVGVLLLGLLVYYGVLNTEFSNFICTVHEGYMYVCMCLTLLFGFMVISSIMSVKLNHYR
uniref:NADH dehydrogenase subunit 6 n=1 Tax=Schyzocotyle nayarensis TaxID=1697567 RepID=A0A172WXU8_SCHNA|nr:NADH dehydrogenase subunit 6 [Schyzocotyle nayarensis]ANF28234.1 NADH dehydrogenase subunit 6 [Schyzocotyle nayarensis]